MTKQRFSCALRFLVLTLIINLSLLAFVQAEEEQERKVYIVYMGDKGMSDIRIRDIYLNMIKEVLGSDLLCLKDATEYLIHTFNNFKGYVAKLTDKEAEMISKMAGVVSIFPSKNRSLLTTRSWDFMGFPLDVKRSTTESDVIIGVFDTGVWPESESFSDEGLSPPPAKWKGICEPLNFTCNNKIIGARNFWTDDTGFLADIMQVSSRDIDGHGTHAASIAAGALVKEASFFGLAESVARGGVPSARIDVYKVCWINNRCKDVDIAAFDAAISDGVDIISLSVGSFGGTYFEDAVAIGAFQAMKNGILTSCPGGNSGPSLKSVQNVAPWILTVAASSIDRKFITHVKLGNGMLIKGISVNSFDLHNKKFPLVYAGDAANSTSYDTSPKLCGRESLNSTLVEGKIVLCDTNELIGEGPFIAGAAGMIMQGLSPHDVPDTYPLTASYVDVDDYNRIMSYARNLTSTSTPYATILRTVEIKDTNSPTVATFSSRGPNLISPGILKPDLSAPGISILAAYPPIARINTYIDDPRSVSYAILYGTSMACPHASGVAAYVKSFHPTWSPAAIKSALMTTAIPMSTETNDEAEFAYGSGHINPLQAINPGLVFDADEEDYIKFLCNEGLNATEVRLISGNGQSCRNNDTEQSDLNYPSMVLSTSAGAFDTVFYRTVTNVGSPNCTYHASVTTPKGHVVAIKVQPSVLEFKSSGEKLSFRVRVSGSIGMRALMSASLVWDDGEHQVRSPFVVYNLS